MSAQGSRQVPQVPGDFPNVVPVNDESEHRSLHTLCHEDGEAIAAVNQAVADGLITSDEAKDFVLGKLL